MGTASVGPDSAVGGFCVLFEVRVAGAGGGGGGPEEFRGRWQTIGAWAWMAGERVCDEGA